MSRDVFIRIPFSSVQGEKHLDVAEGYNIHIGVGSDVVCSTLIGIPEPQFVEWTAVVSTLFLCLSLVGRT